MNMGFGLSIWARAYGLSSRLPRQEDVNLVATRPRLFPLSLRTLVCAAESLSTLKFANRAKNIRNAARVNEDVDQRTLLRKYERELRRLRAELQQRQRELVDKRHLLEVCLLEHSCSGLLAGQNIAIPFPLSRTAADESGSTCLGMALT